MLGVSAAAVGIYLKEDHEWNSLTALMSVLGICIIAVTPLGIMIWYKGEYMAKTEQEKEPNHGLESTGAPPRVAEAMQGRPAAGTPETHP
mgnify:CR=1 FL=1